MKAASSGRSVTSHTSCPECGGLCHHRGPQAHERLGRVQLPPRLPRRLPRGSNHLLHMLQNRQSGQEHDLFLQGVGDMIQ